MKLAIIGNKPVEIRFPAVAAFAPEEGRRLRLDHHPRELVDELPRILRQAVDWAG